MHRGHTGAEPQSPWAPGHLAPPAPATLRRPAPSPSPSSPGSVSRLHLGSQDPLPPTPGRVEPPSRSTFRADPGPPSFPSPEVGLMALSLRLWKAPSWASVQCRHPHAHPVPSRGLGLRRRELQASPCLQGLSPSGVVYGGVPPEFVTEVCTQTAELTPRTHTSRDSCGGRGPQAWGSCQDRCCLWSLLSAALGGHASQRVGWPGPAPPQDRACPSPSLLPTILASSKGVLAAPSPGCGALPS